MHRSVGVCPEHGPIIQLPAGTERCPACDCPLLFNAIPLFESDRWLWIGTDAGSHFIERWIRALTFSLNN